MRQFIIFCSVLCCIFYGCNKKDSQQIVSNNTPLSFNVNVSATAEKGGTVPDVDLSVHGFWLAGYHTKLDFESCMDPQVPNIFNHPDINLLPVPHVSSIGGKYNLPISAHVLSDDTYLSFFAWAQSKVQDKESGIINSTTNATDQGYPWLDVRIADTPTKQCDIVIAKHMNHPNETVVTAVDLDFNHILSKLTFKVKSSSGSKVKVIKANVKYGADKVFREGRYTFSSKGDESKFAGLKSPHSGEASIISTPPIVDYNAPTATMLGDITFIPQTVTSGFISLELSCVVYASSSVEGITVTRSIPIEGLEMTSGTNYTYTIDITADEISISKGVIGDWTEIPMPIDESTIALFDGHDDFIDIGGKKYWPDRSGYNNHAELVDSERATYDKGNKCYIILGQNAFKLPAFKEVYNSLIVDVVVQMKGLGSNVPFFFRATSGIDMRDRGMFAHLGYDGSGNDMHESIFFDAGGYGFYSSENNCNRLEWKKVNYNFNVLELALFTFTYIKNSDGSGTQIIRRNGSVSKTITYAVGDKGKLGLLTTNNIGQNMIGSSLYYLRVRKMNTALSTTQAASEFKLLKERFNIPD